MLAVVGIGASDAFESSMKGLSIQLSFIHILKLYQGLIRMHIISNFMSSSSNEIQTM